MINQMQNIPSNYYMSAKIAVKKFGYSYSELKKAALHGILKRKKGKRYIYYKNNNLSLL